MKFLIILLPIFRTAIPNKHAMIEVWGQPNFLNDAQAIKNTQWNVCMAKCYSSENCILAHNQNETCYMFNEVTMGTVTRTKLKDKSVVAFKANSTNGQCSTGPPSNMSGTIFFQGPSDLITMSCMLRMVLHFLTIILEITAKVKVQH
ncbi:Protein CBG20005 [Caenorhabditis briggsae]|uniref:Protein CBG20005 n=1 Tax=Caenorhabditis briggsae TaxID=6238 RepID=A8XWX0_CAEBR|nr:Protein CBG20005 [Caenorhabditis briggsae]CAP37139.2 Protein CBG20005 [Caenorhabditis briggsae]